MNVDWPRERPVLVDLAAPSKLALIAPAGENGAGAGVGSLHGLGVGRTVVRHQPMTWHSS